MIRVGIKIIKKYFFFFILLFFLHHISQCVIRFIVYGHQLVSFLEMDFQNCRHFFHGDGVGG